MNYTPKWTANKPPQYIITTSAATSAQEAAEVGTRDKLPGSVRAAVSVAEHVQWRRDEEFREKWIGRDPYYPKYNAPCTRSTFEEMFPVATPVLPRQPALAKNHYSFGIVTDFTCARPSERRKKKNKKKKDKDNN